MLNFSSLFVLVLTDVLQFQLADSFSSICLLLVDMKLTCIVDTSLHPPSNLYAVKV